MPDEKQIVRYSDDAAARYVTDISGWVSRDGRFFGKNEHTARMSGCTHYECRECGALIDKPWTVCRGCREEKDERKHAAREHVAWDYKTPVYSDVMDRYFFDPDDLSDAMHEREADADELRLLWCKPVYLRELDPDVWEGQLPDEDHGGDPYDPLPHEVSEALESLNKAVRNAGPVAWEPSDIAVSMPSDATEVRDA